MRPDLVLAKGLALLPALLLAACGPSLDEQSAVAEETALAAARATADAFQGELRDALAAAIEAGGAAGAVEACAAIAPALAGNYSEASGASVRRTALRVRNPLSQPDPFERAGLQALAERPMTPAGKPAEFHRIVGGELRYMRALPTAGPCLQCHGPDVAPEVKAAIARLYPEDQATGFREGELRGAISIRWPLHKGAPAAAGKVDSPAPSS
ncbi:Tll0287-like domain-containing protein [Thermaurantiacus sp.]